MSDVNSACYLCGSNLKDELKLGKFIEKYDIGVHYYCLLLSSNLAQNGEDEDDFLGFMLRDIKAERQRVNRVFCTYCKRSQALIGCCAPRCRRAFHLNCGIENNALNQFLETFRSYCDRHVRSKWDNKVKVPPECVICYSSESKDQKFHKINYIKTPCCKNSWFHRWCLAKFALQAGYFFKCPLCNDTEKFRQSCQRKGVFVPDIDASWEIEANAYSELLERPNECSAKFCKCRFGRTYVSNTISLENCEICGAWCVHNMCLEKHQNVFRCDECTGILGNSNTGISTQNMTNLADISSDDECEQNANEKFPIQKLISSSTAIAEKGFPFERSSTVKLDANFADKKTRHVNQRASEPDDANLIENEVRDVNSNRQLSNIMKPNGKELIVRLRRLKTTNMFQIISPAANSAKKKFQQPLRRAANNKQHDKSHSEGVKSLLNNSKNIKGNQFAECEIREEVEINTETNEETVETIKKEPETEDEHKNAGPACNTGKIPVESITKCQPLPDVKQETTNIGRKRKLDSSSSEKAIDVKQMKNESNGERSSTSSYGMDSSTENHSPNSSSSPPTTFDILSYFKKRAESASNRNPTKNDDHERKKRVKSKVNGQTLIENFFSRC